MFPLTSDRPKPLLQMAGRTIIDHIIDRVTKAGVNEVLIVIGSKDTRIREHFERSRSKVQLMFVEQRKALGTGDALMQCMDHVRERFLCLNGDVLVSADDIKGIIKASKGGEAIAGHNSEHPQDYGVMISSDRMLDHIIEKPGPEVQSALINAGMYVFEPRIFDALTGIERSPRGEYELTDAVPSKKMRVYELEDYWMDIGYPWHLLDANEIILKEMKRSKIEGKVSKGVAVNGPVWIGKGTEVLPGTYIQGPAFIGNDNLIGPNAFIRPFTSIGSDCHIGLATEVKNCIIMDHSNAPHINYLGDSIMGENCNLGAGTKIANLRLDEENISVTVKGRRIDTRRRKLGAIIGHNVKTGINASISVGTIIGSNTYIGMGARVSGTILQGSRIH
jgi:bifunctional UDP-N-acetylglucosamine pyrophosphorylase/glucosamine-1-phosphate N-acetyltransferase